MIWEKNLTKRKTEEKKQSKVLKIQQSKSNLKHFCEKYRQWNRSRQNVSV